MNHLPVDIFGGTFDPVQAGHLELIKNALVPDRVLSIASTTQNPWKDRVATSLDLRLEMLRIALRAEEVQFSEDVPRLGMVFLSSTPYKRSVEFLRYWRANYGDDIRWLVGPGDKASSDMWLNWKEEGCPVIEMTSSYPYHSTDIRNKVTTPHPALVEFIAKHRLYEASS